MSVSPPDGAALLPHGWLLAARAARDLDGAETGAPVDPCLTIPTGSEQARGMEIKGTARRLRFGECLLDDGRGVLIAPGGTESALRPKTLELLRLLLANAGRVVTRNEILDAVWPGLFVSDDSITQCVVELRKAMGPGGAEVLKTLPRRGYILDAAVSDAAAPLVAPAPISRRADDRPSIAVLPFRMTAMDPQDTYFADGIIEGIVHVLSGLDGLFVVSRGSALAFAQTSLDPRAAGRDLGVRYVLHGGVRRAGDRLRITTELSETERATILRADRYDGDVSDIFELQDRIAERVAGAIMPQVKAEELARAMRKPPNSMSAYDLVLRALDRLHRLDRQSFDDSHGLLIQATQVDPAYGLAYSYLGWWHSFRVAQGWSPDGAADAKAADEAARRALECNPSDGFAKALRGILLGYMRQDYDAGRRLIDEAVNLTPSCALAWSWGSLMRCWVGEGREAVDWAQRGVRLAPLDPFSFLHEYVLAQALYVADEFDEAIRWCRGSIGKQPQHAPTWRTLMVSLVAAGRAEEAAEMLGDHGKLDPGFRLARFADRTPFQGRTRDTFVNRLREAGLSE
jgi:TolB-like protein